MKRDHVISLSDPANVSSIRVTEKIGGTPACRERALCCGYCCGFGVSVSISAVSRMRACV
jgi:hypothetical protein